MKVMKSEFAFTWDMMPELALVAISAIPLQVKAADCPRRWRHLK
jgi:hypothetical protein